MTQLIINIKEKLSRWKKLKKIFFKLKNIQMKLIKHSSIKVDGKLKLKLAQFEN